MGGKANPFPPPSPRGEGVLGSKRGGKGFRGGRGLGRGKGSGEGGEGVWRGRGREGEGVGRIGVGRGEVSREGGGVEPRAVVFLHFYIVFALENAISKGVLRGVSQNFRLRRQYNNYLRLY